MFCGACPKCITGSLKEYEGLEEGKILKCLNCGWQIVSSDFKDGKGGTLDYNIPGTGHSYAQIPWF